MLLIAALVFSTAILLSSVLTALVRAVAPHIGLLDRPDGHRKLHNRPIPLGGGLAVFLSTAIILAALMAVPNRMHEMLWAIAPHLASLFGASAVIVLVGLIDDRIRIRGRLKLCGQIAACAVLIANGTLIERVAAFGHEIELGLLSVPFTVFWLLGAINAMNLLDGLDGLTTVLGLILVATIGALGFRIGNVEIALVALVFTGSLIGFLRFNFPPASIFLGDAGSMLIGLVVGSLAIQGSLKGPGTVLLAAPVAIFTIPILDSLAAVIRRKLTGRSIYATDRGHLHHRLMSLLGSNRKVLACVSIFCTLTSLATLASVFLRSDLFALLACSAIVIMLVATGIFGRAEMMLLTNRLRKMSLSWLDSSDAGQTRVVQSAIRLQGSRPWELLWATLTDSAEQLSLVQLRLDVNLPRVQEGYHASWECPPANDLLPRWRVDLPLATEEQPVGYLSVVGVVNGASAAEEIERLSSILVSFEARFRTLAEQEVLVSAGVVGRAIGGHEAGPAVRLARQHPK